MRQIQAKSSSTNIQNVHAHVLHPTDDLDISYMIAILNSEYQTEQLYSTSLISL